MLPRNLSPNFLVLSFLEIYCLVLTMMTQDVVCFSAIISCCEKAGQWQQALTLVDTMLPRNLSPNLVTFNAAIGCCATWEEAPVASSGCWITQIWEVLTSGKPGLGDPQIDPNSINYGFMCPRWTLEHMVSKVVLLVCRWGG
jgi:pentatricopeptide repeat protein